MSFVEEVRAGIKGAMRLFFWDKDAFEEFDLSADGFWRSFSAPIMILPFYYLYLHLAFYFTSQMPQAQEIAAASDAALGLPVPAYLAAYVVSFIAIPLALVPISRLLSFSDHYIRVVVALNWALPIKLTISLVPVILFGLHLLSLELATLMVFAAFAANIVFGLAIIRFATELNILISVIILTILGLIDFVIELLVTSGL